MPTRVSSLSPPASLGEVEAAIRRHERTLARPAGEVERVEALAGLGKTLFHRYRLSSRRADLARAIDCVERARGATGLPAEVRAGLGHELGSYLHERFLLTGERADLDRCVALAEEALRAVPTGSREWAICASSLAPLLVTLYELDGSGDLDRAVSLCEQALQSQPDDSPIRSTLASNLVAVLSFRSEATGRMADLDRVRALQGQSGAGGGAPDPYLPANQAVAGSMRFERLGDVGELDAAIEQLERVLRGVTDPNDRAHMTGQLAILLLNRHQQSGRIDDVERGIDALERALPALPAASSGRQHVRHNLASLHTAHYLVSGQRAHLDQAVHLHEESLRALGRDHLNWPAGAAMLAAALWRRAFLDHAPADLDRAVDLLEQATALMAPDAPDYWTVVGNLGGCRLDRYYMTGDTGELRAAEEIVRRAVRLSQDGQPRLAGALNNLAAILRARHDRTPRPEILAEAVGYYRQACLLGLQLSVFATLHAAKEWGEWAVDRRSWEEAAEAYDYAWRALHGLYRLQLLRGNRERSLGLGKGIAARGALALARAGRLRDAAVAVERGRALMLTDALERDRADLERLRKQGRGDLYDRYRRAAARIAAGERRQASATGPGPVDATPMGLDDLPALAAARRELDQVVTEIRGLPDHRRFLEEADFDDVAGATARAHLVYLLPDKDGGGALVIGPGKAPSIRVLALPALREDSLRETVDRYRGAYQARAGSPEAWRLALDETARWLWDAVMGKLLDLLPRRSRVLLVAGGMLGVLPLHAAWTPAAGRPTGRRYVLDELLVGYAPNARTVRAAGGAWSQAAGSGALVVEEPSLPEGLAAPLHYAACESEAIRAAFPAATVLSAAGATRRALLEALPSAPPLLHLACHGEADLAEPLRSGLLLARGERVTLRDLLALDVRARVAVLSACESGLSGATLPDEVVGLPSGLLQAGFGTVIASLWSVPDAATALLMLRFYGEWHRTGQEVVGALHAAQRWLRDSSNHEKRQWLSAARRSPHGWPPAPAAARVYEAVVLRRPEALDFASIEQWAGFACFGANERLPT